MCRTSYSPFTPSIATTVCNVRNYLSSYKPDRYALASLLLCGLLELSCDDGAGGRPTMYTFKEYNYKSPATELRRSLSLQASSKQRRRRRRPSSDREEISGNMLCGLYTSCGLFASSRPPLDTHINIYQSFAHFHRFYTFHHATLGLSSLFCPLTSVIAEVDSTGQSLYISG